MPLKVHFLNVGHGDCTFLELPSGRLMMVDINNSKSLPEVDEDALAFFHSMSEYEFKSRTAIAASGRLLARSWEEYYESLLVDPTDYYREHFDGTDVFRYVQTHPDLDHMSGLHRFFWQEKIPLLNFWDTDHKKDFVEADFDNSAYSYMDWLVYKVLREGARPDDKNCKVLTNYRAERGDFWAPDNIEILSPTTALRDACNDSSSWNSISYVLKVTYGGRTLILPGDAEAEAWASIVSHYDAADLKCDVLKAAHHGRESGYHAGAVTAMSPSIVICSVGKKPSTDASDEYQRHGARVLSTRFHGSIVVTMWGDGEVWIDNHLGERIDALPIL